MPNFGVDFVQRFTKSFHAKDFSEAQQIANEMADEQGWEVEEIVDYGEG